MSQLEPTFDLPIAAPPTHVRGRLRVPGWLLLIWRNRKSRVGLLMVASMVVLALIAPLISVAHPNEFNLLAARQDAATNAAVRSCFDSAAIRPQRRVAAIG